MLRALRLDPSHRATAYRRGMLNMPNAMTMAFMVVLFLGQASRFEFPAASIPFLLFLLYRMATRTTLQLCADALMVRRFGAWTRRLPYSAISSIGTRTRHGISIKPRVGPPIVFRGPLIQEGNGPRLGETPTALETLEVFEATKRGG